MATTDLIMTLGKVIIAAAWVDGKVTLDEINSLKDLTFRLPEMTAHQWAVLEMYMESPVGEAERARLVSDLQQNIRSAADRRLVTQALNELVAADGEVTPAEEQVVREIEAGIGSGAGFGGLSRFVGGLLAKRSQALDGAPNREEHFEDYIKNKVYYNLHQRLNLDDADLDIPDAELRRLCLAGGIMAQIARISQTITEAEFYVMVNALQNGWGLTPGEAAFVVEVAASDESRALDHLRLAREFVKVCTPDESTRFLDVLFAVAAADGEASSAEIEQIRKITAELLLPNKVFIAAKKKIPRRHRQQ